MPEIKIAPGVSLCSGEFRRILRRFHGPLHETALNESVYWKQVLDSLRAISRHWNDLQDGARGQALRPFLHSLRAMLETTVRLLQSPLLVLVSAESDKRSVQAVAGAADLIKKAASLLGNATTSSY